MVIKDLWAKTSNWLAPNRKSRVTKFRPQIDDQGLINQGTKPAESTEMQTQTHDTKSDKVLVKTVQPTDKQQSIEKLEEGFNNLIKQLQGINQHLNRQVSQNEELMSRIEKLPKWLESFPDVMQNQRQITEQLIGQLKTAIAKDQQFIDTVEKIPMETAKQTDALVDIDHQLSAAADTDVQMVESFNKFNEALDKLNQRTVSQTDSIVRMNRTFATSDRYLKYILSKQNRRFMWVFIAAIGVCVLAILILTGIVIYLKQ
jgi:regulator of replication initiation timing